MKMQPQDKTPVTPFHVSLRTDVQRTIAAICKYLDSSPGHVISEAIALSVAGDKEFATFLESFEWNGHKTPKAKAARSKSATPKTAAA